MLAKLIAVVKTRFFKGTFKWEDELPVKYRGAASYSIVSESSSAKDQAIVGALTALAAEAAKPPTQTRELRVKDA